MTKNEKVLTTITTLLALGVGIAGTAVAVRQCYESGACESKLTDPSVQVDTVRDAPPASAPYVLELISLRCNQRQERASGDAPDEAYFKIMDQPIMKNSPFLMDVGHMVNLEHLGPFPFERLAEIELWDSDPRDNPDEYLGNTFARASDDGLGELTHEFTGSGASYILTYRVTARP